MTLDQWQGSIENITYARELFSSPRFQHILGVLNNSRPRAILERASDTEAAIALGIRQGYDLFLSHLYALTQLPEREPAAVEATYSNEDVLAEILGKRPT